MDLPNLEDLPMIAWLAPVLGTLGGVAAKAALSMLTRLASQEMAEWAIRWGAKRLVENTKTTHDDEWYAKIEEQLAKHPAP